MTNIGPTQYRASPILIALVMWLCQAGAVDEAAVSEYQVKAAFLFNFTRFVEWPAQSFESSKAPFTIGIIGDDPFGESLEGVMRSEKQRTHPIVVRPIKPGEGIGGCQILFISRSEAGNLESWLKQARGCAVLTVSEVNGGAGRGTMINFVITEGRVKMEINRRQAELSGLEISSKLLGLAKLVESKN